MDLYVILRRSGWRSPEELGEAAARSKSVADEQMPDDVRWIRSYVLEEGGGSVGTVCIYEASSPEAIRKHACGRRPARRRDHRRRRHGRRPARSAAGDRERLTSRPGGGDHAVAAPHVRSSARLPHVTAP